MPELRNYQQQGVADIRARFTDGARRVLYQAPTGSRKTVLFGFITQNARAQDNRVAILGHVMGVIP
jgi:superfamily II DNA or RNA helicase